jgi:hypothetical protein
MIGDIRIRPSVLPSVVGIPNPFFLKINYLSINKKHYELTREHRKNTRDNDGNG